MRASLPPDEEERLQQMEQYAILDTPAESAFDRVVRLARQLFGVPVAFVSFMDRERQWFKASHGLDTPQIDRGVAFCAHAILTDQVLVVPDAREDPRFADIPCVAGGQKLHFYAGAPIILPGGFRAGTVGIMDTAPRQLEPTQVALLQDLAAIVVDELELRLMIGSGAGGDSARLEPRTQEWASANRILETEAAERQRIEVELRASESKYRQLVDQSADAIVVADQSGTILEINAAAHTMLGYSYEEVVGKHMGEFNEPADEAEDTANLHSLARGESVLIERWMIRKDGSRLPVEVKARSMGNGQILATARDITERKRAESALQEANDALEQRVQARTAELDAAVARLSRQIEERQEVGRALQESNRRLRTTLESISDGFYSLDKQWRFMYVNASAEKMVGKSRDEMMGQYLCDVFPEVVSTPFWDAYHQAMDEGVPASAEEFYAPLNCWYQVRCYPSPEGLSVYFQDISKRKMAEQSLQEAKAEAERTSEAKSDFLSRMSHELRTPMNAILGFAQLFDLEAMSPNERENIEQILSAGDHLLHLINEVLDVARVESGHVALSIEPVAVGELAQEVLGLVQPMAAQRSIHLHSALGNDGPYVMADRQRFKQVLLNLIGNAIKYNHHGGRVEIVRAASPSGALRVEVRDSGPGISAEGLQKLFVPFERLGAEERNIEGTGIGLALSKRLAELMDGSIGVRSVQGEGSTFWVELPLTPEPTLAAPEAAEVFEALAAPEAAEVFEALAAPEAAGNAEGGQPQLAAHTVLYIEDNLSNLKLIQTILARRPEIKLIIGMQGGIGLDLAREHRPDLILLDLHLPDISGAEVLRRLRMVEATRDIPVVVLSADATPNQIERLREAGARDYLTKPLKVRRFLEVLDECLGAPYFAREA